MKFFHLSDLHIGKLMNDYSLIEDQKYILKQIVSLAKAYKIDAILLAGDIYDKSAPSAEAVTVVDEFFSTLAEEKITLCAIPGNHDSAERVGYLSKILESQGIYIARPYEGKIDSITFHDQWGPLTVWLFPFVKPANVRQVFPEESIESYTDAMRVLIDHCNIDTNTRNIAIVHQFVTTRGHATIRSDSELIVGTLDNVDASVFEPFDYVALGHIHGPQKIGRNTIRYSGTPLKYSLSEANHHKSIPCIEFGEKETCEIELVPLTPLRDVRQIKGPLEDLISNEIVDSENRDDYIHAVLTNEQIPLNAQSQLTTRYPHLLSLSTARQVSQESNFEAPEQVRKKSTFELFEDFFSFQNGRNLTEAERTLVQTTLDNFQE